MIIVFTENFEDFVRFLDRRSMNEVFYEIREPPDHPDSGTGDYHILFHFLGMAGNAQGIYETQISLSKVAAREELLEKMGEMFASYEITLIEGKIREVFMSLS
ncbi:MAG: hypothetical protein ACTSU5_00310 [Promethearchaeota archaeon]